MGTGASKSSDQVTDFQEEVQKLEDAELEQQEKNKKEAKKKKGLFKSSKKKSWTSAPPAAAPPKIVGLVDTDDEEDGNRVRNEAEDDIRQMDDLNRTFESLGFIGKSQLPSRDSRGYASAPAGNDASTNNAFLNASMASSHTRFGPGTSRGRISRTTGGVQQMPKSGKNLRFSWDSKNPDGAENQESEEWTYKKTVIDGFDPDKFRQVNKASGTKTNNSSQFGAIEGTVATTEVEVPGSVPTYDPSEQQLIASLERELMGI